MGILQCQVILTHYRWPAVSLRSVAWEFFQGYSDFIAGLQLSSHLSVSCDWTVLFDPFSQPTHHPFLHDKYKVTIDCFHFFLPETVAAHRVVMAKLCTWFILLVSSTTLSSTIPRVLFTRLMSLLF